MKLRAKVIRVFSYLSERKKVFLDVDECARSCNEEGQQCFNTVGSYNCSCKKGWTLIDSHCVDLNDCNNCQSNAKCMNMDGMICEDMNECEMNNLCHLQAICTNQDCTCLSGLGFSCNDTDKCILQGTCHRWANCRNTNGSFKCQCRSRFADNGFDCKDESAEKGANNSVMSNSHLKIILSVIGSIAFVSFVITVCALYARRNSFRLRRALGYDSFEPPDEWEVNPGNMALLEKLGDGFFGVLYRAYLYQSSSVSSSRQARKERNSFENEKLVVACKMLKCMFTRVLFISKSYSDHGCSYLCRSDSAGRGLTRRN